MAADVGGGQLATAGRVSHGFGAVVSAIDGVPERTVASVTAGYDAMDMGMACMCMAVLAGTLMALLPRLRGAFLHELAWTYSRQSPAPVVGGRDPDPPSLTRLSIHRC